METEIQPRLLRAKEVAKLTGLSRTHIYNMASRGMFPRSIELVPGGVARAWIADEVNEWIDQRIEAAKEAS